MMISFCHVDVYMGEAILEIEFSLIFLFISFRFILTDLKTFFSVFHL